MRPKVCHLTSAHPRYDVRIFVKQCQSLTNKGYDVYLIVADSLGNEIVDKITIYDVEKIEPRIKRVLITTKKILRKAIEIDADIYHFHDPELIPVGARLKKMGKKVVYDVHEDLPRQISGKYYIKGFFKPILSKIVELYENYSAKKFNYIITATPHIAERFRKHNPNTENINNYPVVYEFCVKKSWEERKNQICYLGGISLMRGINQVLDAINISGTVLELAGDFQPSSMEKQAKDNPGWKNTQYYGLVDRKTASEILSCSKAGIVTFLSTENHINSQPNKIFEYMSAGIPVIASFFPLWKEIIEKNNCGICVDPENPVEIANAISTLMGNDKKAMKMGENGRRAVEQKYNWNQEEKKLLQVYDFLI